MSERRYSEEEVRAIFGQATSADESAGTALTPTEGPTLRELEQIGAEVGIAKESIRAAAAGLATASVPAPRKRLLGMPVGVSRDVALPRAMTDREWEVLVSEVRHTFGAKGAVHSSGGLREWSNGNLHILVEPTPDGHQLRMRTYKGNAISMNVMAGASTGLALFMATIFTVQSETQGMALVIFFMVVALVALLTNVIGLPRWAEEREQQMEHLARHARGLLVGDDGPDADPS